jgi:hypothetical protein
MKYRYLSEGGRKNFEVAIAVTVLTVITVLVRFLVRLKVNKRLVIADWLCALSLGFFLGHVAVVLLCKSSPTLFSSSTENLQISLTAQQLPILTYHQFPTWMKPEHS